VREKGNQKARILRKRALHICKKEPFTSANELDISAKEPCKSANKLPIFAKEPYICARAQYKWEKKRIKRALNICKIALHLRKKNPIHPQMRSIYSQKSPVYLQMSSLYPQKRNRESKTPKISVEEPCKYAKRALHIRKWADYPQKSPIKAPLHPWVTWLIRSVIWSTRTRAAWHDSFMSVIWLLHMCDMTRHQCVWRASFVPWSEAHELGQYDMTPSYVGYDFFTCVTWLIISVCDMTHSYRDLEHTNSGKHTSSHLWSMSHVTYEWVIRRSHVTRMNNSFIPWLGAHELGQDLAPHTWVVFICVTWLISVCVTWLI